jgi:glycosyltransferase involved in cell wall biosynthesis
MKILHVTPSYYPSLVYGGPTVSTNNLCKALAETHEVFVITTTANGDVELDVERKKVQHVNNVPVIYFPRIVKGHVHFSPSLLKHLWRNAGKYEVIHIHSWWNLVSVLSAFVCYFIGKKYIISPRGTLSDFSIKGSRVRRLMLSFCKATIFKKAVFHVTSAKEMDEVKKIGITSEVSIIPNIISLGYLNMQHQDSSEIFRLIFLGRIHPVKNLELLFDALAKLPFKFQLQIIGSGEKTYIEKLKDILNQKSISQQCKWLGDIYDDERKQHFLQQSDCLVVLSKTENFSNVIIEALNVGTPVLVAKDVGLKDFILDNDLGWVSDYSLDSVVESIYQAYGDFEKRRVIRKFAPALIEAKFGTSSLVNSYSSLYSASIK